ncbi:MAG: phosphoenolpyruvate carboxylase [Anaerolineae bacterium]
MHTIPKCMSTQHPDNVYSPFFAENAVINGEEEIKEAYYVFSHLGCDEQMWDYEGKEVDNFVVKKLLSQYPAFFQDKRLGKDVFITLRVPNPTVEKGEAKVLLETLDSIPRSFDAAKLFYGDDLPPVFEVILPMTTSHRCLDRIYLYYRDFVVGKQHRPFKPGDVTICEWIGEFKPETIHVIPLFEDMPRLLEAHTITREFMQDKKLEYQRVFLARSDPAMNYGLISAVLLNKIALMELHRLSQDIGIPIYPIVGVGSPPFRGNLRPQTVDRVIQEYPSAHTLTVQSSFKYDHAPEEVREAVRILRERQITPPQEVDRGRCLEIINKYVVAYQEQLQVMVPAINEVAKYVPQRRRRKLHVGLYGYARGVGGVTLPRAIGFTAAMYSLGVPPEILGLDALTEDDIRFLQQVYVNFKRDLRDAVRFLNPDTPWLTPALRRQLEHLGVAGNYHEEHRSLTDHIIKSVQSHHVEHMEDYILRAAYVRRFLG